MIVREISGLDLGNEWKTIRKENNGKFNKLMFKNKCFKVFNQLSKFNFSFTRINSNNKT